MTNSIWPDGDRTQDLLNQVKNGDPAAVDSLLERHRESLRRLVEMRLDQKIARRIDASDIIQDVLVEANRRLREYVEHPAMAFHLWIRQIAKDRIIDAHRRHRVSAKRSIDREQVQRAEGKLDQSTLDLVGELRDSQLTPAAAATQRELALQVELAVAKLPDADRDIILMRHYEHLTNFEVAQSLNLTEPAASMRYLRALRKLRGLLNAGTSWAADHEQ